MTSYREVVDAHKGRGAVASVALRAGTCVLRTTVDCAVAYSSCSWCFQSQVTLQRCTGCRKVRYCSRTCQQQDWSQHRRECSAWRTIPASTFSYTILLVTRLAIKLYLSSGPREEKDRVLKLCHHLADHTKAQQQQFSEMTQLVLSLLARCKVSDKENLSEFQTLQNELELEIMELFGRVNCNAFSIVNNLTNEVTGIGLFSDGSLFNHDCDPNCVVTFKDREMLVHVVKDVDGGQELTISYVELLQSTNKRQKELKESYFFECQCTRCLAAIRQETFEDWFLDGLMCDNKLCVDGVVVETTDSNGEVLSAMCKMCGMLRNHKEISKLREEVEAMKVCNLSEQDKWMTYQHQWEIGMKRLKLHTRNAKVAMMARKMGNFLMSLTSGEMRLHALPFYTSELRAVDWLLPQTKLPARGLLHLQIGKLIYEGVCQCPGTLSRIKQAEQLQIAEKHLQQSLLILDCACGSASAAAQTANSMLYEVLCAAQQL